MLRDAGSRSAPGIQPTTTEQPVSPATAADLAALAFPGRPSSRIAATSTDPTAEPDQ
ncbi:hypothetical protein ACU635_34760 [[Actinomadura] parvosata]|uniref:hypothetical protein n=1 Tax=[Actinomadura] parvosata TaxID=1955412 RepID=UPI00406CE177